MVVQSDSIEPSESAGSTLVDATNLSEYSGGLKKKQEKIAI